MKKKTGNEEEVVIKKVVKKTVKRPTEFKLGKWNPDTVLEKSDIQCEDPYECCHRCNERILFHAVNTDNHELLENLVQDLENIPDLSVRKHMLHGKLSYGIIDLIMKKGDKKMLEIVMKPRGVDPTKFEEK